jgi:hypothetical protein
MLLSLNFIIFFLRRLSELETVDLNNKLAGRVAKEGAQNFK